MININFDTYKNNLNELMSDENKKLLVNLIRDSYTQLTISMGSLLKISKEDPEYFDTLIVKNKKNHDLFVEYASNYVKSINQYAKALVLLNVYVKMSAFNNFSSFEKDESFYNYLLKDETNLIDDSLILNYDENNQCSLNVSILSEMLDENFYVEYTNNLLENSKIKDKLFEDKFNLDKTELESFLMDFFNVNKALFKYISGDKNEYKKIINNHLVKNNNAQILLEMNQFLYSQMNEEIFEDIKTKINEIENRYGMKLVVNNGVSTPYQDSGVVFKKQDINKVTPKKIVSYLKRVQIQASLVKYFDKGLLSQLKNLPIVCGNYLNYVSEAQLVTKFDEDINEERVGIYLFNNIKEDTTILVHEIEHYRDHYFIGKIKETLKTKKEKIDFDKLFGDTIFLSNMYFKNMLDKIFKDKEITENIDNANLAEVIDITFKKQNIYFFGEEKINYTDLVFKGNNVSYQHLKERVTEIFSNYLVEMLNKYWKLFMVSEKDLFEVPDFKENLKKLIHNELRETIMADAFINNVNSGAVINGCEKLKELKSVGILGDEHSKKLMISSVFLSLFKTIKSLRKLVKQNEQLASEQIVYMERIVSYAFTLKNTIKTRLMIKEYDTDFPKYYIAFENGNEVKSTAIEDKMLNNSIKRIKNLPSEEIKHYILSPLEIYARNAQVFSAQKFIKNNFVSSSVNILIQSIKDNFKRKYSDENLTDINTLEEFNYQIYDKFNLVFSELSKENYKSLEILNSRFSEIQKTTKNFSLKLKSIEEEDKMYLSLKELLLNNKSNKVKNKKN